MLSLNYFMAQNNTMLLEGVLFEKHFVQEKAEQSNLPTVTNYKYMRGLVGGVVIAIAPNRNVSYRTPILATCLFEISVYQT